MATMQGRARLIAAVASLSVAGAAFAGPEWPETADAGSFPFDAQIVFGAGPLFSIKGSLSLAVNGPGDFEDMFLIKIDDPALFCAKTIFQPAQCGKCFMNPTQPTAFDTQLWIFKTDGRGLLGNDDDPGDPPRSRLSGASNDGSGAAITTPGLYYIAISGGPANDPQSSSGAIFNQVNPTEISGPDGPGGANPIIAWTGGGPVGQYQIMLCGASFVEHNDIPTTSEWGLIVLAIALIVGGAVVIRKRGVSVSTS